MMEPGGSSPEPPRPASELSSAPPPLPPPPGVAPTSSPFWPSSDGSDVRSPAPPPPPSSSALGSSSPSVPSVPGAADPAPTPPSVPNPGWSLLGATPLAPPTPSHPPRSAGPIDGSSRFLPPVVPPSEIGQPPTSADEPRSRGRWGWRALVAFLAGGLIAAASFAAARVSIDDGTEVAAAGETTPTASPSPSTTRPSVRGTTPDPLAEPPSDVEPAAFVAQTLGPAVVQLETSFGLGSGVLYDDNLILTNNHVVEGAQRVNVTLATGRVLAGRVVGSDPATDVAVVEVDSEEPLPLAELATGVKPQVGQLAIAIGSPFDLQQSVTQGIVSAVDRPIPNTETSVVAMIQTDAPINPGNSGGALADRFGRVIGINTSIQTDGFTSTNVGVGFAIPIDTAVRIADLLAAGQPIEPGFLGVSGQAPRNGDVGVLLTEVTADSAAAEAGLLAGDRVLSLNGAPVSEMVELAGLVMANQAGDTIVLQVVRDGELVEIEAVLGLREDN